MHHVITRLATLVVLLVPAGPAVAGAANAALSCRSIAGVKGTPVKIEGDIPGDFADFSLVVSQGDVSITLSDREGHTDRVYTVDSWKDRVFTLVVESEKGLHDMKMYAIPSSVVVTKNPSGLSAKFTAMADVPIPGYTGQLDYIGFYHRAKFTCTWDWSI